MRLKGFDAGARSSFFLNNGNLISSSMDLLVGSPFFKKKSSNRVVWRHHKFLWPTSGNRVASGFIDNAECIVASRAAPDIVEFLVQLRSSTPPTTHPPDRPAALYWSDEDVCRPFVFLVASGRIFLFHCAAAASIDWQSWGLRRRSLLCAADAEGRRVLLTARPSRSDRAAKKFALSIASACQLGKIRNETYSPRRLLPF